uniref:1,3-beta-glucan synthase n=1 Tax=Opuntia streptacantha TaxID=393608 RepID=A0A7C8ZGV4_OPUST
MSSEIVLTEPIHENEIATHDEAESSEAASRRAYTRSITYGHDRGQYVPEQFDSERLPVTLGSEIRRFLRVANQIELEEPRVAYLCRFHAFERAHNMDRNSAGRGVRQFKTALLQKLQKVL